MTIWVDEQAHATILREAPQRRFLETGGALFGYQGDGDVVVIRAFGPGNRAKHRPHSFVPDRQTTAALIAAVWEYSAKRYRFLGSWHTHPHGQAVPSRTDSRTAADMARQEDLRLPAPLVAIQATHGLLDVELGEFRVWQWDAAIEQLSDQHVRYF